MERGATGRGTHTGDPHRGPTQRGPTQRGPTEGTHTGDPHRGECPTEDPPPEGRATQGTHTGHTQTNTYSTRRVCISFLGGHAAALLVHAPCVVCSHSYGEDTRGEGHHLTNIYRNMCIFFQVGTLPLSWCSLFEQSVLTAPKYGHV